MKVIFAILFVGVLLTIGYCVNENSQGTKDEKIAGWVVVGIMIVLGMLAAAGVLNGASWE